MGMYDWIRCEAPLPQAPALPPDTLFQTKDTPDQYLTVYTITADGRLTWRPYEMQEVPKEERPHPDDEGWKGLIGSRRRVERDPEDVPFHGDIRFYAESGSGWWEFKARFTEGQLARIEVLERPAASTDIEPG